MLLLLTLGALAIGNSGTAVMDAFYRGLWMLLPFTMQMALILVLSSTLGAAPVFKRAVARLSRLPRTHGQVFALACLVVACLGYLFWGLALALGPLVSIYFAREAERKGIEAKEIEPGIRNSRAVRTSTPACNTRPAPAAWSRPGSSARASSSG